MVANVDVRRKNQRFLTDAGWLDSKHSFSFGHHFDANNTHFGLLLVSNDDKVAAGTGFETHPHRDMEIVTWVLSVRSSTRIPPVTTAYPAGLGSADERRPRDPAFGEERRVPTADPRAEDVHFIQMWVVPDEGEHHTRVRATRHHLGAGERRLGDGRVRHGQTQ